MKNLAKKALVLLLSAIIITAMLVSAFSVSANSGKSFKALVWCPDDDYYASFWQKVISKHFENIGNVTVVTKTSGELSDAEMKDVQLVYIIDFKKGTDSAEGQTLLNAAEKLKAFAQSGGRVVLNGEHAGFAPNGNATLSALASAMGGNFSISNNISGQTDMEINTEYNGDLGEGIANMEPNAYAPITSTNASAVWVLRSKSTGEVFVLEQKVQNGYITVLADGNWLDDDTYDSNNLDKYTDYSVPKYAAAKAFLNNILVDSAQNIEEVSNPKIKFDNQSGTGDVSQVTTKSGDSLPKLAVPKRDGYIFAGYYSQPNGKGVKYYNADGTGAKTYDSNDDMTLYAFWKKASPKTSDSENVLAVFTLFAVSGLFMVMSRFKKEN